MKGAAHIVSRICGRFGCGRTFRAKPMGYNARYCSRSCKTRGQRARNPETFRVAAKRSYNAIKLDPERYERRLADGRKSVHKIRVWLAEFKMKSGCVDCGFKSHPAALQFDHEGKKTASISEIRSSAARILAEIKSGKCKVRCANCHSVKTWAHKNGIKYIPGMAQSPDAWIQHCESA